MLIESLFYFFIVIIAFLFSLGLLWNGSTFAFVLLMCAAFLTIFLGAALYSEGIRDEQQVSMDIVSIDANTTRIDLNSNRGIFRTTANDPIVLLLAPTLFYGGIIGLILSSVFLVKAVRT